MNKSRIEQLFRTDQLRKRQLDQERIKSMIHSAETNAKVAKSIPISEESATVVFREIYESVRQFGDAAWWLLGYEPRNHEVSMEILQEMEITERLQLNHLPRYKKIRNDANYRGFKVTVNQAKEIIAFWNACSENIKASLFQKMK